MLSIDWNATISRLKEQMPGPQFQNWIQPLRVVHSNSGKVVVGVPSQFHQDWLRENYRSKLEEALSEQVGSKVQLEFEIVGPAEDSEPNAAKPHLRIVSQEEQRAAVVVDTRPKLPCFPNPYHEFNFNRIVFQCMQLFVSNHPGIAPFGILAGTGLGKTHALSEVGRRIHRDAPNFRIRFTNAESFTNELVSGIRSNDCFSFKNKYRNETDLLLFDDIHLLSKRMKTQEELLHIFNEITGRGGLVAFSTTVHPTEIRDFLEPLKSRLLGGVLAEIVPPTPEQRLEIVHWTAAHHQIPISGEAAKLLSDGVTDIRQLTASVVRVHLQSQLQNTPISLDLISQHIPKGTSSLPKSTLHEILTLVEHNFGISREEIISKSRKSQVTWARQVAMYLARQYTLLPLEEIGRVLGRDHATVIHSFQKVSEVIETQPTKKYEVDFLKRKLLGQI